MSVLNIFSKRQKALKGEVPQIYQHESIPQPLRVQIVHIIREAFGEDRPRIHNDVEKLYEQIHKALCKEYGRFHLIPGRMADDYPWQVLNFLLTTPLSDEVIDVTELCIKVVDRSIREDWQYKQSARPEIEADDAIEELNNRFKEHGVGFQYVGGEIIRMDSAYTHTEIVQPTISLLWNSTFKGASEEYLLAHEHYRHGRNKECLTECLKAFESTMKIICQEKGWQFNQTDTSKKLIQILFQNGLVPTFTQNQFSSLQNLLESGIPTIRNKLSGHGQGQIPQKVDDEMARYGLNLTGSNIIFLVEQSKV